MGHLPEVTCLGSGGAGTSSRILVIPGPALVISAFTPPAFRGVFTGSIPSSPRSTWGLNHLCPKPSMWLTAIISSIPTVQDQSPTWWLLRARLRNPESWTPSSLSVVRTCLPNICSSCARGDLVGRHFPASLAVAVAM